MIGFVLDAIRDRVLAPQALVADADLRAIVDPDSAPIDTSSAELNVVASTTTPLSREIAGGLRLRHVVGIVLVVEDGDVEEAHRRRDAIVTDLVLRLESDLTLGQASSADGKQEVDSSSWTVDYGDLIGDTLAAYASLTFTVDAELYR